MSDASSDWECLLARPGGTVAGLASAGLANGTPLVFAATSAGVYRSTDGGETWTLPNAGAGAVPFVEIVVPSQHFARDHTLFVGGGNGVYRSVDEGASWVRVLSGAHVMSLAVASSGAESSIVFAATELDGIVRSEDSGRSWGSANPGLLDLTVLAIALSPEFGRDGTGLAATTSGLYRTRNAGRSWRSVDFDSDLAVQCLAFSPRFVEDRLALAGTESDGLLRSSDGGARWEPVSGLEGRSVTAVAFSSRYAANRRIAVATELGVAVSADAGTSWRLTPMDHGSVLALTFVPHADTEVLLAGLHRHGVARASHAGLGWTLSNDGLKARVLLGLALSPGFETDQTLFAAGPDDGVLISRDAGASWDSQLDGPDDPSVFSVAPSPKYVDDRRLFVATAEGIYVSADAGAHWQPALTGFKPSAARAVVGGPPGPLVPHGSSLILAALASGGVLASDDEGASWRSLGESFGAADIVSVTVSPDYARDRTIFVGARNSHLGERGELVLWRSVDGGMVWQRWLVERDGDLLPVAVPPGYSVAEAVLVALGNRVMKPLRDAREVRSGERRPIWRGVEVGGPETVATDLSTPLDADNARVVFAATSTGVHVSRDGGEHFAMWGGDGGPTAVVAVTVSPGYARDRLVYALGLGGTLWRRRDIY
jgi:photosystem II stability/assembly factor-like uncharacterized protein